jgi:hypothetical protein
METYLATPSAAFKLLAAVFCLFYAWYGTTTVGNNGKLLTIVSEQKLHPDSRHHWSWWVHEVWINFAGSAIGWSAGYYLIFCRKTVENLGDAFLLLVAMMGVLGFLPWRVFNSPLK